MVHLWTFVMKGVRVRRLLEGHTPFGRFCLRLLLFPFIFIVLIVFIVYSQHIFTPTQIAEQSARLFARGS